MNKFEENIISIHGEQGRVWLSQLPQIARDASLLFGLSELQPLDNLTYNYILSGYKGSQPIILKIGIESLNKEAEALRVFAGFGAVAIIAQSPNALCLERVMPGISLKSYFPDQDKESVKIACEVIGKLHNSQAPSRDLFPNIKDWLSVLDEDYSMIELPYMQKARMLKDRLLRTATNDLLLHGDLHHDNIIRRGDEWVVIDPKGVIGESSYEAASFIINPIPRLLEHHRPKEIIERRIKDFAETSLLSEERIIGWSYVRAMLGLVWAIQDNCDIEYFTKLVRCFDNLVV